VYDGEADLPEPEPEPEPEPGGRLPNNGRKTPVFDEPVAPAEQGRLDLGPASRPTKWRLPAVSTLGRSGNQAIDEREIIERGRLLEDSLAAHGVEVRLVGQTVGPTVTRYELELGAGVKVARVTALQKDIAYSLAAVDVRILAPIPGRSAIGVEVPNQTRQLVVLGDLFASAEAKAATHPLDVAIGKDIAGRAVFLNLATTPHLLIAGATGAGKSSGINCIITSILMRTTPDQVRLILIDPKQVEMGQYNRSPHLLTAPVTNPKRAANALSWAVKEMERRYDLLFELGFRDIGGYNAAYDRGELVPPVGSEVVYERLAYIVVVVDELNDLMMVAARDVEESITRIAQKARAVGIHLIVATQRPSANVITGVIKANIPARMAFAVSSQIDSRVILDQIGAEKLVGRGDMLLLPGNSSVAARIQGAYVSEEEIRKVMAHWKRQAPEVVYVDGVEGDDNGKSGGSGSSYDGGDDDEDEALLRQAMDLVVRSQLGSTSMLQRKLKVGFARAGRIMDLLEQRGVVGPSEGSKARAVLMTVTELDLIQEQERNGR
jgi:S-DNA-T family DNA segregation ATPase FtsK/SpoIIIE